MVAAALNPKRGERQARQERGSEASTKRTCFQHQQRQHHDNTTIMHALDLLPLLGAAFILLHVSEAFVLRSLPLAPSISRSPCSRAAGTSSTSKRSVAYQDSQHPPKSQQPQANDKDDDALVADLEGKFYQWKHGPVHYVEAGAETVAAKAFPVLLLPGKMMRSDEKRVHR